MKKILVLGTGHLGSEIVYTFHKRYEITCVDHGKYFPIIKNQCPNVNFVKGDCYDYDLIRNLINEEDTIFYCVDTGGVYDCILNPEKYREINETKFFKLIKKIQDLKIHNFILLSSGYVYQDLPKRTEGSELNPDTLYGKLRKKQELILKNSGLNFIILRLGNIFGYGHFPDVGNLGAIAKFVECVFTTKKIILHGDGSQKVDFLHKNDLMKLLELILDVNFKNKVYNVSSGKNQSILEVAKLVKTLSYDRFGINVDIIKQNKNTKMPNSPELSIEKVIKETGWNPSTDLKNLIEEMIKIQRLSHKR